MTTKLKNTHKIEYVHSEYLYAYIDISDVYVNKKEKQFYNNTDYACLQKFLEWFWTSLRRNFLEFLEQSKENSLELNQKFLKK